MWVLACNLSAGEVDRWISGCLLTNQFGLLGKVKRARLKNRVDRARGGLTRTAVLWSPVCVNTHACASARTYIDQKNLRKIICKC